ncbi:MAG TPA: LysM peptidoglycan-binding domain-containing protein, partial [Candidatus Eisenbacteria bacterium]|nr:LysM peptidoglycan-binding domain-containing protein [Candidatus Eisenbacteria bacterium]
GGPGAWITENDSTLLNQPAVEDIQLQVNADVLKWIEFFTGAGRSTFEKWMKRSGRYMELFRTVLQREGLPPDLVHLVFVESGFNLNAHSVARAVGPWQFVKSSARLFGLNVNQWVDERKDPEKSTVAAARYLKHLFGIFGDWPLALAAYNAGEGTVLRAIRRQGTTNYWDLRLPRQTEDYVPQFMAALAITRDPARYGFSDVQLDDPMRFDEVTLRGSVDLRALARLADCPYDELKDLNPAIRASAVRGADGVVSVRVPPGRSEIIQQRLRDGAQLPAVNLTVRHRVQHGETLRSIAAEFSVSARDLARANGISRRQPLRRGMMVTVPASLHAPRPEVLDEPDPRASTAYVPPRRIGLPVQIQGDSREHDRATHVVRRGQTLYIIGQLYGVTPEQLREWNHLRTNALRPGMRLRVRLDQANDAVATRPDSLRRASAAAGDSAPAALAHPDTARDSALAAQLAHLTPHVHVVRRGETLTSIAVAYGVSRHDLRAWNHLRSSRVHRGQRLRLVPDPADAADPDAAAVDTGAATGPVVTVQPGQTLSQIAAQHGVSVWALRHANGLRTSRIRAGQRLRLPA